jgi:hypothetical protein
MLGGLISLFIQPILVAGFYIVANDLLRHQPVDFNRFFKGFEFYIQLIVANLIIGIFVIVGLFALIIPGVYLAVSYTFTPFFIIFLGYDFWPARCVASSKMLPKLRVAGSTPVSRSTCNTLKSPSVL